MDALCITTGAQAEPVRLPEDAQEQRSVIVERVGGPTDSATYHRQAVLHVHGRGADGLETNYAAWALACVWRQAAIPYWLYGPTLVTGPRAFDGCYGSLGEGLRRQAEAVCDSVAEILGEWATRAPRSEELGRAELLAAVNYRIAAGT